MSRPVFLSVCDCGTAVTPSAEQWITLENARDATATSMRTEYVSDSDTITIKGGGGFDYYIDVYYVMPTSATQTYFMGNAEFHFRVLDAPTITYFSEAVGPRIDGLNIFDPYIIGQVPDDGIGGAEFTYGAAHPCDTYWSFPDDPTWPDGTAFANGTLCEDVDPMDDSTYRPAFFAVNVSELPTATLNGTEYYVLAAHRFYMEDKHCDGVERIGEFEVHMFSAKELSDHPDGFSYWDGSSYVSVSLSDIYRDSKMIVHVYQQQVVY